MNTTECGAQNNQTKKMVITSFQNIANTASNQAQLVHDMLFLTGRCCFCACKKEAFATTRTNKTSCCLLALIVPLIKWYQLNPRFMQWIGRISQYPRGDSYFTLFRLIFSLFSHYMPPLGSQHQKKDRKNGQRFSQASRCKDPTYHN